MNSDQPHPFSNSAQVDLSGSVSQTTTGNNNNALQAIASNINQASPTVSNQVQVTEADLANLQRMLASVKAQVEAEAPPEKKQTALEKVAELEEAIITEKPDLSTMEYVRNWFVKHLPTLSGAIASVVVHPIVGKLVEAAGDTVADEFRRRFDQPASGAGS